MKAPNDRAVAGTLADLITVAMQLQQERDAKAEQGALQLYELSKQAHSNAPRASDRYFSTSCVCKPLRVLSAGVVLLRLPR